MSFASIFNTQESSPTQPRLNHSSVEQTEELSRSDVQLMVSSMLQTLQQRQDSPLLLSENNNSLQQLFLQDRQFNLRWKDRIENFLSLCRWLGKWLPFHDLELLGQQNFDGLLDLFYYNLHFFAKSPERPDFSASHPELLQLLKQARNQIPIQTEPYRQQPCTPATSISRAQHCLDTFPDAKRVLLLGDDDLTSLSLAWLAGQSGRELEVVVVDIDEHLVTTLDNLSSDWTVSINAHVLDLFGKEAESLAGFDVVLADPSYDEPWIRQFGEWALRAMNKHAHFLLTFPKPLGFEWFQPWVEEMEAKHGLQLVSHHPAFSEYPMLQHRSRWLKTGLRLFLPLPKPVMDAYQSLPFTYSCLWHFSRL